MLPLRTRVGLGAMALKGYSAFPKAPTLLETQYQIFSIIRDTYDKFPDFFSYGHFY